MKERKKKLRHQHNYFLKKHNYSWVTQNTNQTGDKLKWYTEAFA
jgi:hypothetical protein